MIETFHLADVTAIHHIGPTQLSISVFIFIVNFSLLDCSKINFKLQRIAGHFDKINSRHF